MVRFQCGFRFLVAYCSWEKSWKIQNVDCNCWILTNFLIWMFYVKFVHKRYRTGGRFLLVSPERVIRFWCGFRFHVAYSGWKKPWKIQNVGCNGRILVNLWIRMCYAKFVDKRYRPGGRFLLVSHERFIRFWCGFRFLVRQNPTIAKTGTGRPKTGGSGFYRLCQKPAGFRFGFRHIPGSSATTTVRCNTSMKVS